MIDKSFECFDVTVDDNVAHVVLNRPHEMNKMTRSFWNEVPEIVGEINDRALARCIVFSSTGKHFSAGMDLSVFEGHGLGVAPDRRTDRATMMEADRHFIRSVQNCFGCLDSARIPVIFAIQGGCVGGAVDMCSAADFRYATSDAFFVIQEINIGMTADAGTFPRLCKLIPEGWVRELAYTGRRLSAPRAREIGLVNEVFDSQDKMVEYALMTAREIAEKPPVAIAGSKEMINFARDHSIEDGLSHIALWQTGMFAQEHLLETFAASQEKRQPDYPDLQPIRRKM